MTHPSRLYPLLPAWYRGQDASAGVDADGRAPIQAWLERVEQSFETLHAATGAAYDDWFVETCNPELLPALGVLVGLELDGPPLPGDRRLVANATRRWRHKGSAWALKDALEAATGWSVEMREFEDTLLATENMAHVVARSDALRTAPALGAPAGPSLRRIQVRVRRGFEVIVEDADPARLGTGWYGFDPGGLALRVSDTDARVRVRVDGVPVALGTPDAALRRLWDDTPTDVPAGRSALLDAPRGRFWLPPSLRQRSVRVDWVSRRAGPIGAGLPGASLVPPPTAFRALVSRAFSDTELGAGRFRSIDDAIAAAPVGVDVDVRILDSGRYDALFARLGLGRTLTLHAHAGELPCIASLELEGALRLGGVLIAGDVTVHGPAELSRCSVRGRVALAGGHITCCVLGPIDVTRAAELKIEDTLIGEHRAHDLLACQAERIHPTPGEPPALSLGGSDPSRLVLRAARCSFLGAVQVGEVSEARDCLFCGHLSIQRPQVGQLDHCPHPRGSRVAPDAAGDAFDPERAPEIASRDPASSSYGCLVGPRALLEAAADGGEPGAFHMLHVRARMRRLAQQIERFLPVGFEAPVEMTSLE